MNQVLLWDAEDGQWLTFQKPSEIITAYQLDDVLPALRRVEQATTQQNLYAAGFLAYEAAPAFDAALRTHPPKPDLPLLWFGLYGKPDKSERLPKPAQEAFAFGEWQASVSRPDFLDAVEQIKDHIARGDTYQVNYTFRLRAPFRGSAWSFFCSLERAQQIHFAAYVDTNAHIICSASPELFFQLDGEQLSSRPMKGTVPRGCNWAADEANVTWLQQSQKNRAENVMIVDMIRNDMGRVATVGSVRVPSLFDIERYPTVLQMTSTVESDTQASLVEIMQALFPCASITGAPKVRTMQIIADLETEPRGVYTGAVGFITPDQRVQFNVAIRTVVVDKTSGWAEYGVGSGIVWDSESEDEYEECRIKTHVLTQPPPVFSLLESLLWEPTAGFFLLERHLQRLQQAARYFVISLDVDTVERALHDLAATLPSQSHKVRLLASQQGDITVEAAAIVPNATKRPLHLGLATEPVQTSDPFLYHKTTHRSVYEQALASRPDCDDVLLWNEAGEVTESTRANVVVKIEDEWVTPPVGCGLLAGTYRAELLAQGVIRERVIRVEELTEAESIRLINSVRGWMAVEWVAPAVETPS
ncbi:MAG TPA: aminodeoxychorismate synthase component I [Caldilineae bacterium]|nr:aminodeoxychorismate synthase component I [Caldilineae bacterium]